MDALLAFLSYFGTAAALLAVFTAIYTRVTPYNEFALIRDNNTAAAITLAGALLGFTFPLMAAIYFTHDLLEMVKWGVITGVVQLLVFGLLRRFAERIEQRCNASAILMAGVAIAVGLLNGICISE